MGFRGFGFRVKGFRFMAPSGLCFQEPGKECPLALNPRP